MKQALTAGGQLLVWYAGARSALEQMDVTNIIADHTQPSLSGCHPEFGPVAVDFIVPEEGKTRMEIAFSDPQFIQDFKKSVIPEYKAVVKRVEAGYSIEEIIHEQEKAAEIIEEEPAEEAIALDAEVRTALSDQPACEIWGATEALDMDNLKQGLADETQIEKTAAQPEEPEQDEEDEDQEEYIEEPKPAPKKSKGKLIGIIVAAIAVVAIAAGAVYYFFVYRPKQSQETLVDPSQQQEQPVNPTDPTNPTDPQNQDPAQQVLVSAGQYDQIQNGMTYEQVCQIFGKQGTLLSTSSYPDEQGNNVELQIYYWDGAGESGANASISFQGGVVLTKSSFGLQ